MILSSYESRSCVKSPDVVYYEYNAVLSFMIVLPNPSDLAVLEIVSQNMGSFDFAEKE